MLQITQQTLAELPGV